MWFISKILLKPLWYMVLVILIIILKALAHYNNFHNNYSKRIVVKIVAHIENC